MDCQPIIDAHANQEDYEVLVADCRNTALIYLGHWNFLLLFAIF